MLYMVYILYMVYMLYMLYMLYICFRCYICYIWHIWQHPALSFKFKLTLALFTHKTQHRLSIHLSAAACAYMRRQG